MPLNLPPSAVLGAEIFYFHDAYYRGLVGRTLIFDRAIGAGDIAALAGRAMALRGQEKPEIGELREEDLDPTDHTGGFDGHRQARQHPHPRA